MALNTWQCPVCHTVTQGQTTTQIDFVLTKEPSAGAKAKQAKPWVNCHVGSWKKGGHLPILAKIPLTRHWVLPAQRGPREKIRLDCTPGLSEGL